MTQPVEETKSNNSEQQNENIEQQNENLENDENIIQNILPIAPPEPSTSNNHQKEQIIPLNDAHTSGAETDTTRTEPIVTTDNQTRPTQSFADEEASKPSSFVQPSQDDSIKEQDEKIQLSKSQQQSSFPISFNPDMTHEENHQDQKLSTSRPVEADIPDRDPDSFQMENNEKTIDVDYSENDAEMENDTDLHKPSEDGIHSDAYDVDETEERIHMQSESEPEPQSALEASSPSPPPHITSEPIDLTTPERSQPEPVTDPDPLPLDQSRHDIDEDDDDRDEDDERASKDLHMSDDDKQEASEAKEIIDLDDDEDDDHNADEDDADHTKQEEDDEEGDVEDEENANDLSTEEHTDTGNRTEEELVSKTKDIIEDADHVQEEPIEVDAMPKDSAMTDDISEPGEKHIEPTEPESNEKGDDSEPLQTEQPKEGVMDSEPDTKQTTENESMDQNEPYKSTTTEEKEQEKVQTEMDSDMKDTEEDITPKADESEMKDVDADIKHTDEILEKESAEAEKSNSPQDKEQKITAPMFGIRQKPSTGGMVSFLTRPTFQRSSLSPTAPPFVPISQQTEPSIPSQSGDDGNDQTVQPTMAITDTESKQEEKELIQEDKFVERTDKSAIPMDIEQSTDQNEKETKITTQDEKPKSKIINIQVVGDHTIRRLDTYEGRCLEISNISSSTKREDNMKPRKNSLPTFMRLTDVHGKGGRMELCDNSRGTIEPYDIISAYKDKFRVVRAKNVPCTIINVERLEKDSRVVNRKYYLTINVPNFLELHMEIIKMMKNRSEIKSKTNSPDIRPQQEGKELPSEMAAKKRKAKLAAEKALLLQKLAAHRKKQKMDGTQPTKDTIVQTEAEKKEEPSSKKPTLSLAKQPTTTQSSSGINTPGIAGKRTVSETDQQSSIQDKKKARLVSTPSTSSRTIVANRNQKAVTFSSSALKNGRVVNSNNNMERPTTRRSSFREHIEARSKRISELRGTQIQRIKEATRTELLAELRTETETIEQEAREARKQYEKQMQQQSQQLQALSSQMSQLRTFMLLIRNRNHCRAEDAPRLERNDPDSEQDYIARVRSFSPATWAGFGDIGILDPITCARFGWYNSKPGIITSSNGAELRLDAKDEETYAKQSKKIREKLVSAHKLLSPWTGRVFEKRPMDVDKVKTNAQELCKVKAIPQVVMKDCKQRILKVGGKLEQMELPIVLAACNWQVADMMEDFCLISCEACGAQRCSLEEDDGIAHFEFCDSISQDDVKHRLNILGMKVEEQDDMIVDG